MSSVTWRLQGTSGGVSPVRLLIVYDKQTNGATPATVDIESVDAIRSPMNLNNNERFIIVADETYEPVNGATTAIYGKGYRKLNLPVEFNAGSAGTVADITKGALFALAWQNGSMVTMTLNQLYTRVRYTDA